MPRVIHFEINAEQPERAGAFYRNVFGWKVEKWGGPVDYWLVTTGKDNSPGINGAIMTGARAPVVNTIDVPSWDEFAAKIAASGGSVGEKQSVPGIGYFAYCQDTEGNTFGIMESDESVA